MKEAPAMKKAKAAMKKKVISKIAKGVFSKSLVFRGSKEKTVGGLKKTDLVKNKTGKVVSAKMHKNGKEAYKRIKGWTVSVQKARAELKIKGFVAVKKGTPLYKRAKELY